jgi:hypothetical protein
LAVDPETLYAAGSAVGATGDGVAASLSVLTAGFAANIGRDLAGMVFGLAYQDAAKSLLKAATAAVNACRKIGALIQQGASNYSAVDAASTLGGGGGVLPSPCPPAELAAPGPPGTLGPGEPAPSLWWLVQSLVHDVWPDGDVAGLRAAAARWRGFGAAVGGVQGTLNASKTLLDTQHLPEGDKIDAAMIQIGTAAKTIGEQCGKLATTIDKFADRVDHAQHAIRDLLHRLESLADFGHDVMLIIEGDALDEVEEIAKDINDVLQQLGQEARAYEQGIKLVMQAADGEIVKCEKFARRALVQFLGADVGNPVATGFDTWINAHEGLLKDAVGIGLSLGDLSPHWFFVDPQGAAATWTSTGKGLWKGSLFNGFLNPKEYAEAKVQELKGLVHFEDWNGARPGLAAGENLFDVLTAIVPGAGEAGAAADGAGAAARGAEEEAAGAAGRAGGKVAEATGGLVGARGALTDITRAGGDLTKNLEGIPKDLPKIDPPASGTPVALPQGKPFEAPVESGPRPADATPGAPQGSTPTTAPDPAPAPPSAPGGPVGPHQPAPAPAAPPAAGGPHDPAPPPTSPSAPGEPDGPHDPPSVPLGDSHEPAPASAETPHDPVSSPTNPHDPEPAPPQAPTSPGGSHDPPSAPPGSPHEPAPDGPHEPVSTPVEPARAEGPRDPVSVPAESPREPVSVPGGGSPLTSVPAPVGERTPSAIPQPADHSPERLPSSPGGSLADPAPVSAYSPQPVAVAKSAPHAIAPGGRPAELPAVGGSPRAPGKGGPAGGDPKPPHNGGQQPPRDPPGGQHHVPTDGGDHPSGVGDHLDSDDLVALTDYTGPGHRDLNSALRSGVMDASQQLRVQALNNALAKLPPYEGPVIRGTNLPPEVLAKYRPGEVITEDAFLSTSMNTGVARSPTFAGNVEFRILSKSGRDISSFSVFPDEAEVLFPTGTRFYVASKVVDPLTGRTVIRMVEP